MKKPMIDIRYLTLLFGMFASLLGCFLFENLITKSVLLGSAAVCGAKSGKILRGE